ncbi:uncharacterized protein LOC135499735 [Lineus longissimus]|uniref:uncharacterized protein LOC135499735 n=1 Tax=Lineus longissimus TaxID=88925 RepID=UPI00315D4A0A
MKLLVLAAVIVAVSAFPEPRWMKSVPHGEWGEWNCDGLQQFRDRVDCETEGFDCIYKREIGLCEGSDTNALGEWSEWGECIYSNQHRSRECSHQPCAGVFEKARVC